MKAYDIALFMIFFLLSVNFISASGILGSGIHVYYGDQSKQIGDSLQASGISPKSDEALSYPELAISAFGLLVRSLVVIVLVFAYSTILLPMFLGQLGLPVEVTAPVTIVVWMAYVVGYAQYRARSTLQGTE